MATIIRRNIGNFLTLRFPFANNYPIPQRKTFVDLASEYAAGTKEKLGRPKAQPVFGEEDEVAIHSSTALRNYKAIGASSQRTGVSAVCMSVLA